MKSELENSGLIDIRAHLEEMKRRDKEARQARCYAEQRRPLRFARVETPPPRAPHRRVPRMTAFAALAVASLAGNAFALAHNFQEPRGDSPVAAPEIAALHGALSGPLRRAGAHLPRTAPLIDARTSAVLPKEVLGSDASSGRDEHVLGSDASSGRDGQDRRKAHPKTVQTNAISPPKETAWYGTSSATLPPVEPPHAPPPASAPVDLETALRRAAGVSSAPVNAPSEQNLPNAGATYEGEARQLRPSAGAIMAAVGGAQAGARRCMQTGEEPRTCKITFRSDGTVKNAHASGGDGTSACIEAAFARARTDAFADATYTTTVVVRP